VRALVVGGGSWGTAFAGVLAEAGHDVELACRDPQAAAELAERRENRRYLPGARLAEGVRPVVLDLAAQAPQAELVALALPAAAYAETAAALRLRPGAYVLTLAKGLDQATHRLLTDVVVEATGHDPTTPRRSQRASPLRAWSRAPAPMSPVRSSARSRRPASASTRPPTCGASSSAALPRT
jgi:glycerol-3-phosphate dehydrogenase